MPPWNFRIIVRSFGSGRLCGNPCAVIKIHEITDILIVTAEKEMSTPKRNEGRKEVRC